MDEASWMGVWTGVCIAWLLERAHLLYYADFSSKSKEEGTFANILFKEISRIYESDRICDMLKEELTSFPLIKVTYNCLRPKKNSLLESEVR